MTITPEIFENICQEIETTPDGVQKIVQRFELDIKTFYRYVNRSEANCQRYARAKDRQCDNIADDLFNIVDLSDDPNKARVQIDARKFYLSKIKPKRYGDHQVIEIQSEMGKIIDKIVPAILKYVPDDKRSEAMNEIQASLDFDAQ